MHARNSSEFLLALDSIQARSQVFFLWGAAMQKGDRPNETRRGKSLEGGGGALVVWDWSARQVYNWGAGAGVDLECVDVCHLGLSGGMLPRNIFNFKPSEMAANAFKTNMGW